MVDVFSSPRRRHARSTSAMVDIRSIRRSDSYPVYNSPPHPHAEPRGTELISDTAGASSSNTRTAAAKIVNTVRRSFSTTRRREASPVDSGMYSTPEESSSPISPRYNVHDAPRPTIQQIAMGLHVSRTPYLRQPHTTHSPSPHSSRPRGYSDENNLSAISPITPIDADSYRHRGRAPTNMRPPPPRRSSLKKPDTPAKSRSPSSAPFTPSASDLSLTGSTLTSSVSSTPRSNRSVSVSLLPTRLQLSMSKLLRAPSRKGSEASSMVSANSDDGTLTAESTPRKMVRFSSSPANESELTPSARD